MTRAATGRCRSRHCLWLGRLVAAQTNGAVANVARAPLRLGLIGWIVCAQRRSNFGFSVRSSSQTVFQVNCITFSSFTQFSFSMVSDAS